MLVWFGLRLVAGAYVHTLDGIVGGFVDVFCVFVGLIYALVVLC